MCIDESLGKSVARASGAAFLCHFRTKSSLQAAAHIMGPVLTILGERRLRIEEIDALLCSGSSQEGAVEAGQASAIKVTVCTAGRRSALRLHCASHGGACPAFLTADTRTILVAFTMWWTFNSTARTTPAIRRKHQATIFVSRTAKQVTSR